LALEIVADDVIPDQVVRPQCREGAGELLAPHQSDPPDRPLAPGPARLVDEDAEYPRPGEIEQGGEPGHGLGRILATRGQRGQGRGQDGAADAEPERVDAVLAGDLTDHANRVEHAEFEIVVPG